MPSIHGSSHELIPSTSSVLAGEVQDVHFPNLEERPDLPQEGAGDPMSRRDERGVQFDMVDSIIRITLYKALVPIVQLAYVGRLGVTALAGASVAMSVANLTGFLTMVRRAPPFFRMKTVRANQTALEQSDGCCYSSTQAKFFVRKTTVVSSWLNAILIWISESAPSTLVNSVT